MTPRILMPMGWQDAGPERIVRLGEAERHHLVVVLRRRPGDAIELFDGQGRSVAAVLEPAEAASAETRVPTGSTRQAGRVRARELWARLRGAERVDPTPPLSLTLAQGISSNERMDWTLEKAVEIGVDRIVPLQSARTARRTLEDRRRGHWERILAAACAQSGRNHLPALDRVREPEDWLQAEPLAAADTVGFLLEPTATRSLTAILGQQSPVRHVRLACGPEAGFEPAESQRFVKAGWQVVGLGPRTLRTETAALIAMAIIQSQWGDLR